MQQAPQKYRALESSQRQPFVAAPIGSDDPASRPTALPRGKRYLSIEECLAHYDNFVLQSSANSRAPKCTSF